MGHLSREQALPVNHEEEVWAKQKGAPSAVVSAVGAEQGELCSAGISQTRFRTLHIYYRTDPQFFNRNIMKRGRERKEGKIYLKPHTKLRDRLSLPVFILAF